MSLEEEKLRALSEQLRAGFNKNLVQPVIDQIFSKAANADELPKTAQDAYASEWCILFGTKDERIIQYANMAAQEVFDYTQNDMIGLPSSRLAGPDDQQERDALLERAAQSSHDIMEDSIVRYNSKGGRITISNPHVFTLDDGRQGAYFRMIDAESEDIAPG